MPYFKFKQNDIFHNRIKTHPNVKFFIYDRKIYYQNMPDISGSHTNETTHVPRGFISLYEMKIDRPSTEDIKAFALKDGSYTTFKTLSSSSFAKQVPYGAFASSSYPYSASVSIDRYSNNHKNKNIRALKNTLNYLSKLSPHYSFTGTIPTSWDKFTQYVNLISIPSIFYGSKIKPGSVKLNFYVTGTLIGQLTDYRRNGELIQTLPVGSTGSGSIAGVCLYQEGFMLLTASWALSTGHSEPYIPGSSAVNPKWLYFASTGSTGAAENLSGSSFSIEFDGTQYVPVSTYMCHAQKGQLNWSNNLTHLQHGQTASLTAITSSDGYFESPNLEVKNVAQSAHVGATASFERITYISQIGLYDENKDLIAICKLAKPIRKRYEDDFTFKIKMDY